MADTMKLSYFDARGRAELSRLLLAHAGVKYEDNRVTGPTWQALKPKCPKGSVPILEHKGYTLCESMAIARYIARETNLYGSNNHEATVCDIMVESGNEIVDGVIAIKFKAKTEEEKAEAVKKLGETLGKFDKLIASHKKGDYIVGNKLSLADISVYASSEWAVVGDSDLDLSKFPAYNSVVTTVKSDKNIAAWIASRPESTF